MLFALWNIERANAARTVCLPQASMRWRALLVIVSTLVVFFITSVAANAETRTLRMYFTHTKESATITFKRNGKYIPSGLRKANRFLRDWRRKEPTKMDPKLLDLVWEVYQKSGSRKPIHVISGYRSPRTNNMLRRRGRGVAKTSQHTRGKALDFFMPDVKVTKLRALGLQAHRGGVGYYRGSFVHLDTGRVRHWPRMSRKQLARVFPRGRTVHVPSNGKPLKGYKVAAANLKRGRNADGSRRSTPVSKSLLASIFKPSGNDGDENESAASKKAVAKPVRVAKAKPAPKPVAKKPVAVAASSGPDPFNVELKAARNANVEQAKPDAAEEPAVGEAIPEETIVLAAMPADRLAVPRKRPGSIVEAPVQVAAADLIAPSPVTQALRPAVAVPTPGQNAIAQAIPLPGSTENEQNELRSRVQTALARRLSDSAPERAVQQAALTTAPANVLRPTELVAPAAPAQPVTPSAAQPSAAQIAALSRSALEAARIRRQPQQEKIISASLNTQAETFKASVPTPRQQPAVAKTNQPVNGNSVPVPAAKPRLDISQQPARNLARTEPLIRTGAKNAMVAELSIGDLDGREVKRWAIAASTRVGSSAVLRAPDYRRSTQRLMPSTVYATGFANARFKLQSDRFSGRSLTRVAFAELPVTN